MPTLDAPNRTVNPGTEPRARSSTRISAGRSKNPGRGENVCDAGTAGRNPGSEHDTSGGGAREANLLCARSCASLSSLRASSSIFVDSVRFRNTSVGYGPPTRGQRRPNELAAESVYAAHIGQNSDNLSDAKETTPCSIVAQQGALYAGRRRLREIPHFVPILVRRGVRRR